MNATTACFMFAHKTKGEHGSPPSRTESEAFVCIGQYQYKANLGSCSIDCFKLSTRMESEALVCIGQYQHKANLGSCSFYYIRLSTRTESEALACIVQYQYKANLGSRNFGYIKLSTRTESEALACLTILGLRYIVQLREEINGKRRKNCGVSR